ncbi:MAG: RluA family pseudouridine synthase, partial [Amnibacterium sp.]
HPKVEYRFAVVGDGRPSVTHYETVEGLRAATLLDGHLETGRTHQIRVHFAHLKHPLVGDTMYGADPVLAARLGLTRQWLHAVRLGFAHPATGEWVEFESPLPADLAIALERLAG